MLTGKEIAEEGKSYDYGHIRKDYSAAIDKIIEGDPSRSEYDKEIRKEGEKVMPGLKELYEQQGYRVQVDKRGVITSISWGEEPEKSSEEKQQSAPQKPQRPSLRRRLKGLFP